MLNLLKKKEEKQSWIVKFFNPEDGLKLAEEVNMLQEAAATFKINILDDNRIQLSIRIK